jgi:hypothetical protein
MENNESDLYAEYLQSIENKVTSINKEVAIIRKRLETQPQAKDYSLQLETITAAVQVLRTQVAKPITAPASAAPPALDATALAEQLGKVVREEVKRHQPGYVITKWVRYGTATFIGLAMVVSILATGWWQAVQDRNRNVRSNWLWRYSQQSDRAYTNGLLEEWQRDSINFQQAVARLEAKELLLLQAKRKQEEADALRAQATHGKKK